ncbi:cytochrome p450 [Moniliophthora roreri]|nr:cytochrome p450 [Moniliophthora roreri]
MIIGSDRRVEIRVKGGPRKGESALTECLFDSGILSLSQPVIRHGLGKAGLLTEYRDYIG